MIDAEERRRPRARAGRTRPDDGDERGEERRAAALRRGAIEDDRARPAATTKTPSQIRVDFRSATARAILASGARRARSDTIGRDVRFLRQAALLLPSAFLLGVLALPADARPRATRASATYPVLPGSGRATAPRRRRPRAGSWSRRSSSSSRPTSWRSSSSSAWRSAERARLRPREGAAAGRRYGRAFGGDLPGALPGGERASSMWFGERAALRQAPGRARRAAARGARRPFAGARGRASFPAAVLAGPLALLSEGGRGMSAPARRSSSSTSAASTRS